jgi:hypothetical protein
MGDVLVAEDGTAMRLAIVANNQRPKLLMQITHGNSEICGPGFSPDGSKLYFSSQRGPSGPTGTAATGVIYEMTIPPLFRNIQRADAFTFRVREQVAPAVTVTSEMVTLLGFLGTLELSISTDHGAEFSIDDGAWQTTPVTVQAGDALRIRHTSSANIGEGTETTVRVGLANGASETLSVFRTVTSAPDTVVDPFAFGERVAVAPNTLIESDCITPTGFNLPVSVVAGPGAEYRIHGGAWTSATGVLEPEQTLQTRHLSMASSCHPSQRTYVRLGRVKGYFTTTIA